MDECPLCGTWLCHDCGQKNRGRNRFYSGAHRCSCLSEDGEMLPVKHRILGLREDHKEAAEDMLARQMFYRYPLETK